jgi:hypothetical protein
MSDVSRCTSMCPNLPGLFGRFREASPAYNSKRQLLSREPPIPKVSLRALRLGYACFPVESNVCAEGERVK